MRHADRPESIEPTSARVLREEGVGSPTDNGGTPPGKAAGRLLGWGPTVSGSEPTYIRPRENSPWEPFADTHGRWGARLLLLAVPFGPTPTRGIVGT